MKAKEQTIKNMPVGTRFIMGGHGSLMIKTDFKISQLSKGKAHLCVSENGMAEMIFESDIKYPVLPEARNHISNLSANLMEKFLTEKTLASSSLNIISYSKAHHRKLD